MHHTIKQMKKTFIIVLILIAILFMYTKLDKMPPKESISKDLTLWKLEEQIFEYKGYRLSYHDSRDKSKEVVVLLHGFPTSSYDWHLIWPELSSDYRLIAMDMLGFGFSDKPDNIQYSISLQTDILEALLKELDIKKVHLLAHDYGDNVAQEIIARDIENKIDYLPKVTSIMLLNGGLFPETHQATTIQNLLRSPMGGIISSFTNSTLFEKTFSKVFGKNTQPSKQELIDQWYLICQNNGHKIGHKLTHAQDDREMNRQRWVGALETSSLPIVFLNGLQDPVTGMETVERYEELIPNPKVIKLDSVGHYPQLENPTEVIYQFKTLVDEAKGL